MADRAVAADATSGARLQTVASVATACAVATVGVLPMFLAGALGVLLRHDTGLSEFVFGIVIALFWLFSALSAVPAGRVLDRLPARISLVVGAFGSSVALLIVALVIDLVKKGDAQGSWQASHFSWRIRSVLWAGILYVITIPLWLLFIVPGWIAWGLISIWFLYRIVRGMVAMNDSQPVGNTL